MKWNRYEEDDGEGYREFDHHSRKVGLRIFGWSLTAIVAGFVALLLVGVLVWVWAPWKGKLEARQQTQGSGAYRIAAYDQFFDDCNAIKAKERIIGNFQEELEGAADQRAVQLQAAITAEFNAREELIAEYNSNAAKEDTRGGFRDSGLPYEIDPEGVTECSV